MAGLTASSVSTGKGPQDDCCGPVIRGGTRGWINVLEETNGRDMLGRKKTCRIERKQKQASSTKDIS